MNSKSLADYWKLDATVHEDVKLVEVRRLFSDYDRNIRRQERKELWHWVKDLGSGGYGTVHLEINKENQKLRAVKKIKIDTFLGHNEYTSELNTLLEFSQPRSKEQDLFVEFFGWFRHSSILYLAMEYIERLDLETYVATRSGKVNEIGAALITKQILQGLEFMHREKFAHRDLKPANIMVVRGAPQWWVKLADFGMSKKLGKSEMFTSKGGTKLYMAPERCWSSGPGSSSRGCTYAVDLWATGCIAYRLVAGAVTFPTEAALLNYCRDKSLFPLKPLTESNAGDSCISFIKALLATSPTERPSAVDALGHVWITSVTSADYPTSELQDPASSPTPEGASSGTTFSDIPWDSDIISVLNTPPNVDNTAKSPDEQPPAVRIRTDPVVEEPVGDEGGVVGTRAETQQHSKVETVAELQKRAALLTDQERYSEAELVYRRVIAVQRRISGRMHRDTLKSKYELANTLSRQERYEKAEKDYRSTLRRQERALGFKDRDTLKTMHSLAGVLYQQYKYGEAEAVYRETVSLRRELLGVADRDTLTSMSNLAKTLIERGEFKEAEELHRSTLAGRQQVLGRKHRDTLTTMHCLADTLLRQGHHEDAERLHRKTLGRRQRALGFAHPETLASIQGVADSLSWQDEFSAAREWYQMALSGRREVLGEEHPDTVATLECLRDVSRPQRRR